MIYCSISVSDQVCFIENKSENLGPKRMLTSVPRSPRVPAGSWSQDRRAVIDVGATDRTCLN